MLGIKNKRSVIRGRTSLKILTFTPWERVSYPRLSTLTKLKVNSSEACYSFSVDFVVLSSSRGTVFQSVLDSLADGSLHARCIGLISNAEDHGCVSRARKAGLPVCILEHQKEESREEYDKRVHASILTLQKAQSDPAEDCVIACMGWMFLLSPWFVSQWKNRILNVHPSLLPKHPGRHAHDLVLAAGDTESGMTIHLIDEGMDTGKILVQKKCSVYPNDTVETLKYRVQDLECEWYPKVLEEIHQKKERKE